MENFKRNSSNVEEDNIVADSSCFPNLRSCQGIWSREEETSCTGDPDPNHGTAVTGELETSDLCQNIKLNYTNCCISKEFTNNLTI